MINKIDKWIDLSDLPTKQGHGANINKKCIDWMKSIGYIVNFKYDDIIGEIEIVNYISRKQNLLIKYQNKIYTISHNSFVKCGLGRILEKITVNFKIEINTHIKDEKRDLIIVDREYRKKNNYNIKWYKYICQKCHYQGWSVESSLFSNKTGCACCGNQVVVEGINSIVDRESWMIPYFQGGYDEAKLYMPNSQKKIQLICPDCGNVKTLKIQDLYKNHSIGCSCSDHVSFAEKFMIQLFKQLNINFIWQANKSTFKWITNLISYDFYLPDYNCIIETHGEQHYNRQGHMRRTLDEEKMNDIYKEELAKNNHITNYIIINCKNVTNLKMIDNVLDSNLFNIVDIDLSQINWNDCLIKASKNIIKEVCTYFLEHSDMTTTEIGEVFKLDRHTILYYLKFGTKFDWCNYDVEKEKIKRLSKVSKIIKNKSKNIEAFKNNISLGVFLNSREIEECSIDYFGIRLTQSNIAEVCRGNFKQHKGFTFKYISKEEYDNRIGELNGRL